MRLNLLVIILALVFTSCVHQQQSDDLMEITEFGQKSEATLDTSTKRGHIDNQVKRTSSGEIAEEPALTRENLRSLHMILHRYAKKVNLDQKAQPATLGFQHEEIIQTLAGIEDSERSSLAKSVLTLAIIEKSVYSYIQSKEDSKEESYRNTSESEKTSQAMPTDQPEEEVELFSEDNPEIENLDILVKNYDINITEVLTKNRLLAFPYIHNFILISLKSMIVSNDLKEEIEAAIKTVATPWVEIYRRLAPEAFRILDDDNPEIIDQAEKKSIPTIKQAIPFFAGDITEGEDQLNKARKLANKHLYSEAISSLQAIAEDSPFMSTKKEMIKRYSNLAVKDLRRKAAQSFQNAIPAPGLDAKLGYLKEAEGHLIDALEEYPDADQLVKVRENLTIIQKRIKSVENQIDAEM